MTDDEWRSLWERKRWHLHSKVHRMIHGPRPSPITPLDLDILHVLTNGWEMPWLHGAADYLSPAFQRRLDALKDLRKRLFCAQLGFLACALEASLFALQEKLGRKLERTDFSDVDWKQMDEIAEWTRANIPKDFVRTRPSRLL